MGNYERVIPVLFRTMNTYGVVPLRRLDLFVEVGFYGYSDLPQINKSVHG